MNRKNLLLNIASSLSMRISEGSIFYFIIDQHKLAVGQVIKKERRDIVVVIFNKFLKDVDDYRNFSLKEDDVIIWLTTMPTFFNLGRWKIISTDEKVNENYPRQFKIETLEGWYIINLQGEILRKATPTEKEELPFLNNVSPSIIENATKAYFSLIPKEEYVEYLLS